VVKSLWQALVLVGGFTCHGRYFHAQKESSESGASGSTFVLNKHDDANKQFFTPGRLAQA